MKKEPFPYEMYKRGDKPTVYCLVCSRQITNVNKNGKSGLPFIAGMIAPENFGGVGIGYLGVCADCAKDALQDGRINVFRLTEDLQCDPDEGTVFGL